LTVLHWRLAVVAIVALLFAGRAAIGQSQIWTAVCVYVLPAIIKKELGPDVSLYAFLQMLSVDSFEKRPAFQRPSRWWCRKWQRPFS
jgi:hypothetical protein